MYVKHLMEYLEKFVDEDKGNAINNARVYVERQGALHEISRIEVLENNVIGQPSILVAFKTKDDPKEKLGKNHFLI